jgi:hypothetical protein
MRTVLIAVATAVLVVNLLEPWGLATFGLWGWWLVTPLIGAATGSAAVGLGFLVRRLRWSR